MGEEGGGGEEIMQLIVTNIIQVTALVWMLRNFLSWILIRKSSFYYATNMNIICIISHRNKQDYKDIVDL